MSISGGAAIIGAYLDDDNGGRSGSAYIFRHEIDGSWTQEQKLLASDGASSDNFGGSVSISGNVAFIGAVGDGDNGTHSGSVYVFIRQEDGNWTEHQKLIASDGASWDDFGASVSVFGDVAVIGAHEDDNEGISSGSAYLFARQPDGLWVQQQRLAASDGSAGNRFGYSLSISSDFAVIGAYMDNAKGDNSGSAYVFARQLGGTWIEQQKLTASDGAMDDWFGYSVLVSGDVVLLGAFFDDDHAGSAYIFVRQADSSWVQKQKLTASDGVARNYFGASVSVYGEVAVVGAHADSDNSFTLGSAYMYVRQVDGSWSEVVKLTASDGASGDLFGVSASVWGDVAILGAMNDDDGGLSSGSAYLFNVNPTTVNIGDATPSIATTLLGNTPNPFNPSTTIRYSVASDQHVSLTIYNISGQVLRTLIRGRVAAGVHNIVWNGTDDAGRAVASGVYIYRLSAPNGSYTKRMLLIR